MIVCCLSVVAPPIPIPSSTNASQYYSVSDINKSNNKPLPTNEANLSTNNNSSVSHPTHPTTSDSGDSKQMPSETRFIFSMCVYVCDISVFVLCSLCFCVSDSDVCVYVIVLLSAIAPPIPIPSSTNVSQYYSVSDMNSH